MAKFDLKRFTMYLNSVHMIQEMMFASKDPNLLLQNILIGLSTILIDINCRKNIVLPKCNEVNYHFKYDS